MLQKIIHQLNERDYSLLSTQIEKTKADKHLQLLCNYRNEKITDKELSNRLNLNITAFYTLKSRLFVKIQYFLFKNTEDTRSELIKNIAKIDYLVYNTPRETSIPILKKLEAELIKNDMPNELITVYQALKQMHLNSTKHYDYTCLYNKHVAYYLAQDKAADMLSSFCKILGVYYLNREHIECDKLRLSKKEMDNLCRLYDSHRLKIYNNLLTIQYALFVPGIDQNFDNLPVEQLLSESAEIIESFKEDKVYKYFTPIIDYLYFEYYFQLKLQKSALQYYNKIASKVDSLILCNHTCFTAHLLLSKIEYMDKTVVEFDKNDDNPEDILTVHDLPNYILFYYNCSIALCYQERYTEAIQKLNTLFRIISFKNISFIEAELKLFLAVVYILNKDEEHSNVIIKNIARKVSDDKDREKYIITLNFIKFLKSVNKKAATVKDEKSLLLYQLFKVNNKGRYRMFEFISTKDELFTGLITKQNNK